MMQWKTPAFYPLVMLSTASPTPKVPEAFELLSLLEAQVEKLSSSKRKVPALETHLY